MLGEHMTASRRPGARRPCRRSDVGALGPGADHIGARAPPVSSSSASTMMDLPAPVSPVSTVRPAIELELDLLDDREVAHLR